MYEIVKSIIESGRYELADMLRKIDTLWVQNELTEEQKKELAGIRPYRRTAMPDYRNRLIHCTRRFQR